MIEQALTIWNVPADRLTLELTERHDLGRQLQPGHSVPPRPGLLAGGRRFRHGYSSMAYLRQLPLNELKIDQLFVRRAGRVPADRESCAR